MRLKTNTISNSSMSDLNEIKRVLAIDPGTRALGYASFEDRYLEDYGVKDIGSVHTAVDTFDAVDIVISRLIQQKAPGVLAIEKNQFSQIQQNLRLTLAIGKIKAVGKRHGLLVLEYSPRTIRRVICQDGNASKRELARTLSVKYPELRAYLESNRRWREKYHQNAFDAIACGLTHIAKDGRTEFGSVEDISI